MLPCVIAVYDLFKNMCVTLIQKMTHRKNFPNLLGRTSDMPRNFQSENISRIGLYLIYVAEAATGEVYSSLRHKDGTAD